MQNLKIWFTDFWPEWNIENFITPILSNYYNIILDKNNPDILFHSIFNRMSDTPNYKCKKILILAENWRPSQFKSDYSISFDPHSETNYQLPLWQMYILLKPELKERLYNREKPKEFKEFCAFIVSNPSNFIRNTNFYLLNNNYKHVKSYGRYLMNDHSLQDYSQGKYWRDAKDNFFKNTPHKFMMAFENSSYKYYCTEKLMDAFLGGSIPIYWGDPKVSEFWNEKSFINVRLDENWIEKVKVLNENEDLYNNMFNEPVFRDEQKFNMEMNLSSFEEWLVKIINNTI